MTNEERNYVKTVLKNFIIISDFTQDGGQKQDIRKEINFACVSLQTWLTTQDYIKLYILKYNMQEVSHYNATGYSTATITTANTNSTRYWDNLKKNIPSLQIVPEKSFLSFILLIILLCHKMDVCQAVSLQNVTCISSLF